MFQLFWMLADEAHAETINFSTECLDLECAYLGSSGGGNRDFCERKLWAVHELLTHGSDFLSVKPIVTKWAPNLRLRVAFDSIRHRFLAELAKCSVPSGSFIA